MHHSDERLVLFYAPECDRIHAMTWGSLISFKTTKWHFMNGIASLDNAGAAPIICLTGYCGIVANANDHAVRIGDWRQERVMEPIVSIVVVDPAQMIEHLAGLHADGAPGPSDHQHAQPRSAGSFDEFRNTESTSYVQIGTGRAAGAADHEINWRDTELQVCGAPRKSPRSPANDG